MQEGAGTKIKLGRARARAAKLFLQIGLDPESERYAVLRARFTCVLFRMYHQDTVMTCGARASFNSTAWHLNISCATLIRWCRLYDGNGLIGLLPRVSDNNKKLIKRV